MSGSTWVDVIVIALALLAALSGWRQGAVASGLAVVGVASGAMPRSTSRSTVFFLRAIALFLCGPGARRGIRPPRADPFRGPAERLR